MNFTVKYKQITSPYFIDAMHFLTTQTFPVKVAYNIKKVADKLEAVKKKIALEYQNEIVEKFAKKNADGSLAHPKDADGKEITEQFDLDETQKDAMKAAVEAFGDKTVDIDRYKITIEELGNVELTASHLSALDPILTSMEDAVAEQTKAAS